MPEKTYTDRELNTMFTNVKENLGQKIDDGFNTMHIRMDNFESETSTDLMEIKQQTTRTNGRVGTLEQWQNRVIGFCACITVLLLPLVFFVASIYFHTN